MWQPDGWGFRARLGMLVPHAAIGSESELAAMRRRASPSTPRASRWG